MQTMQCIFLERSPKDDPSWSSSLLFSLYLFCMLSWIEKFLGCIGCKEGKNEFEEKYLFSTRFVVAVFFFLLSLDLLRRLVSTIFRVEFLSHFVHVFAFNLESAD